VANSRRTRPRSPQARPTPRSSASPGSRPPARSGASRPTGATSAARWTTPGASPFRTRIELASRKPLVSLYAAPRWIVFVGFLALAVGTALAPSWWGLGCALVLSAFLTWLLFLSWPRLKVGQRLVRLATIGVLVGVGIVRVIAS
jgi:hypothetical protein